MKFDVQDIPDEFAYLREATRRYGHLSHHDVILDFLENKTEGDMKALRGVAETIIAKGHARAINKWIRASEACGKEDIAWAVSSLLSLIDEVGIKTSERYESMSAAEARRKLWKEWDEAEPFELCWLAAQTKKVFSLRDARRFVVHALRKLPWKDKRHALMALYSFPTQANVRLVERFWRNRRRVRRPATAWGTLAALSGVDWPTLRRWLESGGPLRAIAINALMVYTFDECVPSVHARPQLPGSPGVEAIRECLTALCNAADSTGDRKRLSQIVGHVHELREV